VARRGVSVGLVVLASAAALVALSVPSSALAAPTPTRWCGTDESADDRVPDAVASYQLHAVYAIPADGVDHFFDRALPITRDLAAIDTWWRGQDPSRTLRFDLAAFTGCDSQFGQLDLSMIRLAQPGSAYASLDSTAYPTLVRDLLPRFSSPYKKYVVYYDGPVTTGVGICGFSGQAPDRGASFSFVLLNSAPAGGSCGNLGVAGYSAKTQAHEIIHNLGAVLPSAPHYCGNGHVCDSGDVMTSGGFSDSLFAYTLDVGRDDYYGHPGSWWDVRNSLWLSHLDAPQYTLTVSESGSAPGTVASDLPGVSCPSACTSSWDSGSRLQLTATASADRTRFVGWTGACTGDDDCTLTMDGSKQVSAVFAVERTVKVAIVKAGGAGRVTSSPSGVSCPGFCETLVDKDSKLVLKATPDRRSRVVGWSVAACARRPSCSVVVAADRSVGVTFGPADYRLTAAVSGDGRVKSAPSGISCTRTCSAAFPYGRIVRLTADPAPGWRFAGWSGDCRGRSPCRLQVTTARRVRADFRRS
jgi:hypothetical protein